MLYETYREKLARRTRAFERVWRFRLLFLAVFLLLLAGACALMGVAGGVTAATVPEVFAYGEPFSATAETVFGRDYGFEYRPLGTEKWSEEEPRAAGEYECRAFGRSVIGTKRYGGMYTFRIEPVSATVQASGSTLVYGEDPVFTAALRYDDTLSVTSYTKTEAAERVTVEAETVAVYNAAGKDVTSSYVLTTVPRTLTDVKRALTVTTEDASFGYDGSSHSARGTVFGGYGLAEGHTFEAAYPALTEAGSCPNLPTEIRIRDGEGTDVTDRYDIAFETGTLTVARRKLVLSTPSDSLVYDGTAHTYEDYTLAEGGLAEGEEIVLSALLTAQDAGTYKNAPHVAIFADGVEKTRNYDIETQFGTVEIAKRELAVTTASHTFVYDGTAHTFTDCTSSEPVPTHTVEFSGYASATDAGEYANTVRTAVRDGDGRDVTRNYAIEAIYGTVTVEKRAVAVRTGTRAFVYDGTEHTYPDCTPLPASEGQYDPVAGHAVVPAAVARLTDCGAVENELSFTVRDGRGRDVTANYLITAKELGTLSVTQREVTLRADSGTFEYDGRPHSVRTWTEENGTLAAGHRAEGTFSAWTDAETYVNRPANCRILDRGGRDVTANYAVRWEDGSVTVTKRAVTLLSGSGEWTYDAQPHTAASYTAAENTLVAGHTAQTTYSSRTAAGEEENAVSGGTRIFDENRNDVTKNYEIAWRHGTLRILQRPLTVTTTGHSWMYDAAPHTENGYTVENLVAGHIFGGTITSLPEIGERGSKKNEFTFSSFTVTAGGEDVTGNYLIGTWVYGDLVITPRPLTVVTESETRIYDGEARAYEHWRADYSAAEQLAGHEVRVRFTVTPGMANVGKYPNACEATVGADGKDVTRNYEIAYTFGTLTVDPRPILVRTGTRSFVYDDLWHEDHTHEVLSEEGYYPLVEGHSLEIADAVHIRDVGTAENVLTFRVGGGADLTRNYTISLRCGTLEVTPLAVTLLSGSGSFEYDAQPHSVPSYEETGETKLAAGHRIAATYPARTDAGETVNEPAGVRVLRGDGSEVGAKNYLFTWQYGKVTVTKREVTLLSGSGRWTYDAQPHTAPSYAERKNTLVAGHTAETAYTYRTDAGQEENRTSETRVYDENRRDVTDNYTVTWQYGTLTVDPRPVVVLTNSHTWEYDGKYHTEEGFTSRAPEGREGDGGLVEGHRIVPSAIVPTSVKNVTEGTENELSVTYEIVDGENRTVTKNYEVTFEYGTLVVTVRPISVTTGSGEWVYDGEYHSAETCTVGEPAEGHTVQSWTPVPGTALRVIDVGGLNVNMMQVTLVIHDEEGEDVTENYSPVYTYGRLQVTPRPITVRSGNGSATYDGEPHTFEEGWEAIYPAEYPQLAGHEVRPLFNSYTRATTFSNGFTARIFVGSKEVTGNFTVTQEYGTATIYRRKLTITTGDGEWVYDGNDHSTTAFTYEKAEGDRGLAPSDEIRTVTGTVVKDITDKEDEVGYVPNEGLSAIIRNRDREIINECYDIEWVAGRLRVKTPIVVRLFSLTKQYDGEPLSYGERDYFIMKKPPDVEESWISVRLGGSITAPGAVTLETLRGLCSGTVVNGGEDYTARNGFVFEGAEEPLKVTKRVIHVTSLSISQVQGTEPLYGDGGGERTAYWVSRGSLLSGHRLECDVTGVLQPDEKSAENTFDVHIYDEDGTDVTELYYEVEKVCGTLSWLTDGEPGEQP